MDFDILDPVFTNGTGRMGHNEYLILDGCGPLRVELASNMRNILRQDREMTQLVRWFGHPWRELPSEIWAIIKGLAHVRTCLMRCSCMVSKPGDPEYCFRITHVRFLIVNGKVDESTFGCSFTDRLEVGPQGVTVDFPNNREMGLLYQWRRAGWMKNWPVTLAEKALYPDFWTAMIEHREQKTANERARQTVVREERERARARRHGRRRGK